MNDRAELRRDIKALIRWYERRGKDWTGAATFTLMRGTGILEQYLNPWRKP